MQDPYDWKLNYEQTRFYNDPNISHVNKDYVRGTLNKHGEREGGFLQSYNVSKLTLAKFYNKICYVLHDLDDLKKDMNDPIKLAKVFDKLHSQYSPSTYLTILEVTKRYCAWLNGGELPKAFDNVKKLTKEEKTHLRKASNSNYSTLEWEEGLKLIGATNDIQDKAFVMVELDAGMRPQEYLNLNYGDVKRDGKFYILHVSKSKTGVERDVIIYKSAPYLNRWLEAHPSKLKSDPLWILKRPHIERGLIERYTQNASKKLLTNLTLKAKIDKRVSMYMLRHSACRLSKLENMNPEMASQKFGHSISFYSAVYGKTSVKDKLEQAKKHYGEKVEDDTKSDDKPKICPVCNEINESARSHCSNCNSPLTLAVALTEHKKLQESETKIATMEHQFKKMSANIDSLTATISKLAIQLKTQGK